MSGIEEVWIKLRVAPPLEEKHGLTAGRVMAVIERGPGGHGNPKWYVIGDAGERVGVLGREAYEVPAPPAEQGVVTLEVQNGVITPEELFGSENSDRVFGPPEG